MAEVKKYPKVPFKRVDDVKEDFHQKIAELEVEPSVRQTLFDYLIEENRQAWIRGKEYGWHKARKWQEEKQKQAQVQPQTA